MRLGFKEQNKMRSLTNTKQNPINSVEEEKIDLFQLQIN